MNKAIFDCSGREASSNLTGTTFSKTPVVIQDLKPNTRYSVTVQTLLGGRVVAEFTLDDLRTASTNSGPHELNGVGTTHPYSRTR